MWCAPCRSRTSRSRAVPSEHEPAPSDNAFQLVVKTQGRFEDPRQFRQIIVRSTDDGRLVRLQDVARVELGAQDYVTNSYLNNKPAVALAIFQRPGTNALASADSIIKMMSELKQTFPPGLDYEIVYNPTEFIADSVSAVYATLFEAVLLVVLVIIVFLQSWRTAIIPIVAIPVSLIGTFAVMAALGFSINTLTLFGMVLAIGIVVDDAIVVVENVERNIALGLSPARCGSQDHGRGRRRGRGDRARARGGVHPDGFHPRHHGPVLSPIRVDDRRIDADLGVQLADLVARLGGACC